MGEHLSNLDVAIAGTGPAGLMAAQVAAEAGLRVRVFEKRAGPGRKLLIAGSSGLNITYEAPLEALKRHYEPRRMDAVLDAFPPPAWLGFVESLGVRTFKGTSRRWFVEGMKAPPLLAAWIASLQARGVTFEYESPCLDFEATPNGVRLTVGEGVQVEVAAAALCLGGASWEKGPSPIPGLFARRGIGFTPFRASNAGFRVAWPAALLAEAEGRPIKNVVVTSPLGSRAGDLVITAYGLEGTPIYAVGAEGPVTLDLKPDLSHAEVLRRLQGVRENLSPMRRVKRCLKLGDGALALIYHMAPAFTDLEQVAAVVKAFPLVLGPRQPLEEAISSAGGVRWDELDEHLMLTRAPGVFVAGETIDWDAPTGGFLVQGCASCGFVAGRGMVEWVQGRGSRGGTPPPLHRHGG